jgi:hypothetical protein
MKGVDRLSDLEEVLKSIEELRSKLNKFSEGRNLSDPEVVSASQMLDALLNEYQKLMQDKKMN